MTRRLCIPLSVLLAGASLSLASPPLLAQPPAPTESGPVILPATPAPTWSEPVPMSSPAGTGRPGAGLYGSAEYLFWWVKSAPLSVPIVTTGPVDIKEGILVNSTATILYGAESLPGVGGNPNQNLPGFSGTRLTLGAWLDDEQRFGIEGSGFLFERKNAGFQAQSDATGRPGMRLVAFNRVGYTPGGVVPGEPPIAMANMEDGLPIAVPDEIAGRVNITNSLRLWGASVAGLVNLARGSSWELTGLAGFRYLDLYESFDLYDSLMGLDGTMFTGQSGTLHDHFQTRNQFYGGTLGVRGRYSLGSLSFEASSRVSLGTSHEVVNIGGNFTAVNFPPPTSSGPEGFFAQPANAGRRASDHIAVVPELQLKMGYAVTSRLRATIGYDFLYMSSVVRPGDQINRNIPVGQTFNQDPAVSTIFPTRLFIPTDFFAHGVSAGLEFRY